MITSHFDVERARRDTRGCHKWIHFNNAGASLMPVPVVEAMHEYLRQEEQRGGYEVMEERAAALENFYAAAARLLNCQPDEIAFVDSASRGWMAAFYAFDFKPGDRILTGCAEYGSNLVAMLQRAKNHGIEIVVVPDDEQGQIDVQALEAAIDERVRLIAITHAPSGNGLINPVVAVGQIARAAGIPYLLDACQSLGQMPIDVEEIGCDLLCGTGRKFLRGPRGTGLLYLRRTWLQQLEPAQLNHHAADLLSVDAYRLRDDARRFECWERCCAGQLALGVAIDYARDWGLTKIRARIQFLASALRQRLESMGPVCVTDPGVEKSAIVSFSVPRNDAFVLHGSLRAQGINISQIPFSANPYQLRGNAQTQQLRASLHYFNTETEIDRFCRALEQNLVT